MSEIFIRPASVADLASVAAIFFENQLGDDQARAGRHRIPSLYQYELGTGELYVAERVGEVVGFAGLVQRGKVAFLSDLFVRSECQSSGIGARLLGYVRPPDGQLWCTLSSADPRALALYTRSGLLPFWPYFPLLGRLDDLGPLPSGSVAVVEAAVGDPDLVRWDAEIAGRHRPGDHKYWVERRGGIPLWFTRHGERVGYGYLQTYSDDLLQEPRTITFGPIGTRLATDALACVAAALRWGRTCGTTARLSVPGRHPALAPLLRAGFRIAETETFCSSTESAFLDVQRYLPSGGDLF
jgi:ribosomal protein S18 acetylase RimI-like enzyme